MAPKGMVGLFPHRQCRDLLLKLSCRLAVRACKWGIKGSAFQHELVENWFLAISGERLTRLGCIPVFKQI